jgi:phosphomannomutase
VVGTLMTNMAVELALQRLGVKLVRAKVGDRYVLEELARAAGCWAARARATCWRWTSTPRATAW